MSHFISTRARAKSALLLLGSVAAVMSVGVASAATTDGDVPNVVVRYSEESLATDAGVNDVYHRIVLAAKRVCPDESTRDLERRQRVELCREQAVNRAVQKIHNSRLAALSASHSKNG